MIAGKRLLSGVLLSGFLQPDGGQSSASRQLVDHRIELVEVANLEGEQALLAQPAQLQVGLEAERFLDTLFERPCIGALGSAGRCRLAARLAGAGAALAGRRLLLLAAEALEVAYREFLVDGTPGQGQGIGQADQRAAMAGRQVAVLDQVLDGRRQVEQAQRVGDVRAALAHGAGNIFLRLLEVGDQPLIALGLVDRRQIGALQVFDQADLQGVEVADGAQDDRNVVQLGELGRPPTALAGDDLVAVGVIVKGSNLVRGCILPGLSWPIGKVKGVRFGAAPGVSRATGTGGADGDAGSDADGETDGRAGGGAATAAATSSSPRRALRPRPRPRGLGDWLMGSLMVCLLLGVCLSACSGVFLGDTATANEFARQQDVGLCSGAGIVVDQHRHAVRRCLGDADVARNRRAEYQLAIVGAHVGLDLLAQGHATIDHGQDDPGNMQLGVEPFLHAFDRIAERADALERQELRLQRNDHGIDRDQGVEGDQTERRRTIDQNRGPALADLATWTRSRVSRRAVQGIIETMLAALDIDQLDLGTGQLNGSGHDIEAGDLRGTHAISQRVQTQQELVGTR